MEEDKYAHQSISLTPKGVFWLYAETAKAAFEELNMCEVRHAEYETVEQAKAKCRLILAELVDLIKEGL